MNVYDLKPNTPVWVTLRDWAAGPASYKAILVSISLHRSLIRYLENTGARNYGGSAGQEVRVPNSAITQRENDEKPPGH